MLTETENLNARLTFVKEKNKKMRGKEANKLL